MEDLSLFVTNFIKAIKNHKLYQKLSDTTRDFIDKSYLSLKKVQENSGPVVLLINEDKIISDSKVLHSDPKRITSVPLFLYRNGIRSLTFLEGIEKEELESLIRIIASREYSSKVGLLEDLWEEKFPHIIYHAVEKMKGISEYEDIKIPKGIKSDEIAILSVKVGEKESSEGKKALGLSYKPKFSLDRENAYFLLIESIKDLLSYEKVYRRRKSLYSILKDSIPNFLSSGNISALYQTKKLLESIEENKRDFIESIEEIKEKLTSEEALQLYVKSLSCAASSKIKEEAVELIEFVGIKAVDSLINELEITTDFIVKDLILSILKNIFAGHKEKLKAKLFTVSDEVFKILLLIIKKLKDPYFIPCLKELFEKRNSIEVQEILFSLLPRKELLQYLSHPNSDVRTMALEKLKAIWDPEEFEIIKNIIISKNFWNLPKNEIKALLELLGSLSTDDAIKIFSDILRKRHLFNEKIYEIKEMALWILSKNKNEKALQIISQYRKRRRLKKTVEEILKKYERK
ncbi:MAG: hypothetical protein ABIN61_04155 [candidate division WOR-3 bacterium]